MEIIRGMGRQRGGATTEAVIATPAFLALVLTAIELIVVSWKILSLQMIASEAARDYSLWFGCTGTSTWTTCPNFNFNEQGLQNDMVLNQVTTRVIDQLGPKYALRLNSQNTTVTVGSLMENRALNACGNRAAMPGTEDGRGEMFELRVRLKNDILGLGLFKFDLVGTAPAVMEPYGR